MFRCAFFAPCRVPYVLDFHALAQRTRRGRHIGLVSRIILTTILFGLAVAFVWCGGLGKQDNRFGQFEQRLQGFMRSPLGLPPLGDIANNSDGSGNGSLFIADGRPGYAQNDDAPINRLHTHIGNICAPQFFTLQQAAYRQVVGRQGTPFGVNRLEERGAIFGARRLILRELLNSQQLFSCGVYLVYIPLRVIDKYPVGDRFEDGVKLADMIQCLNRACYIGLIMGAGGFTHSPPAFCACCASCAACFLPTLCALPRAWVTRVRNWPQAAAMSSPRSARTLLLTPPARRISRNSRMA